jgi:hypothetical protein
MPFQNSGIGGKVRFKNYFLLVVAIATLFFSKNTYAGARVVFQEDFDSPASFSKWLSKQNQKINFSQDYETKYGGNSAAEISVLEDENFALAYYELPGHVIGPGDICALYIWAMSDASFGQGPFARVVFLDNKGGPLQSVATERLLQGRNWEQLYVDFVVPPQTETTQLQLIFEGTGRGWFDEVEIRKIDKAYPQSVSQPVVINVAEEKVKNDRFYGFGAETLPWLWTRENLMAGVDERDLRLNIERIEEMNLPLARVFVPWEVWNPHRDYKNFTYNSDEMISLYRLLDVYEKSGTQVILVTVDWMEESPWRDATASAQAVVKLLRHLAKTKNYGCIKYWTLTNEPELTYGWLRKAPLGNYFEIHRLVKDGLKQEGLDIKIIASDEVISRAWFRESVQSLGDVADVFSSHRYFLPEELPLVPYYFKDRIDIINSSPLARQKPFFLTEFGFRGRDFSALTNSLMSTYEYGLYVASLAIDALNSGVDAASIWCLYQIRLIDEVSHPAGEMMRIGLWGYKDEDWQPYPAFYAYGLFTKYIPAGSRVIACGARGSQEVKAAAISFNGKMSIFVLNTSSSEIKITIEGLSSDLNIKRFLYQRESLPANNQNGLKPDRQFKITGSLKDNLPAQSLALYTNL